MKKCFNKVFMIVITISILLLFGYTAKAAALPKLTIVNQPKKEYKNGDTIAFKVTNPNYSGKVEYRVILYNGTTKKTTNLWNTPETGYFYRGWQPAGNYTFEIHWPVSQMDPGAYSMTVLVRKANSTSKYDSFIDTNSFYVVNTTSNVDTKFIGDGTEKRVSTIDVKYDLSLYDKQSYVNKKMYYAKSKYFNEVTPNNTINDNIIFLSKQDVLYTINTDGKEYVMFIGGTSIVRNYNTTLSELKGTRDGVSVFDDKLHNFQVYLYEIFYDKASGKYYLANEIYVEKLEGIAKEVSHSKGEIPKYVAIPVMVADY